MNMSVSTNRLVLLAAVFLTVFANVAFFRNLANAFAGQPNVGIHLVALAIVLLCVTILFLLLFSSRFVIKPALIFLFLVSSASAYFMDTYNVVIDEDMLVNAFSTNAAETADLLTPKFVMYILLMSLVPSYLIWDLEIRRVPLRQAILARLKLGSAALVTFLAVALIFSSFFASFVREHKLLRYYSNPITPLYSVYQYAKKSGRAENLKVMAIGTDAAIPIGDLDRELIIMVVGETARADRFSINGYERKTNPRLEHEKLVSFTNVQSCGTSTFISVPCMFDREDRQDFTNEEAASTQNALDVLGHAGVTMLWRDNNSDSKGVADRIPFEDYRSPENNPFCDVECRDHGMLEGLQEYIDSVPGGDVLIVLHQMGSHGPAYYKRYPDEYRIFRPTCDSSQLDSCSQEEISNSYDNTIVYTDHFLAEVISFLRKNDDHFETAMFYASDHGESLGEQGVYLHGMPYWMAPEAQTGVAMILWLGKNYDAGNIDDLEKVSGTALTHDNIFHTLLGLFEIRTSEYVPEKDVLHIARVHSSTHPEYISKSD